MLDGDRARARTIRKNAAAGRLILPADVEFLFEVFFPAALHDTFNAGGAAWHNRHLPGLEEHIAAADKETR